MQHALQTHILRAHMLVQRPMLLRGCVLLDKANWVSGALAWRSEPERHPGVELRCLGRGGAIEVDCRPGEAEFVVTSHRQDGDVFRGGWKRTDTTRASGTQFYMIRAGSNVNVDRRYRERRHNTDARKYTRSEKSISSKNVHRIENTLEMLSRHATTSKITKFNLTMFNLSV